MEGTSPVAVAAGAGDGVDGGGAAAGAEDAEGASPAGWPLSPGGGPDGVEPVD